MGKCPDFKNQLHSDNIGIDPWTNLKTDFPPDGLGVFKKESKDHCKATVGKLRHANQSHFPFPQAWHLTGRGCNREHASQFSF